MLKRLSAALQNAMGSFSSSGSLLDDFLYHWRMVLKFYERSNFYKNAVETTNIPAHLDQLLEILVREEEAQDAGTTGPCMEYFLYHKFLHILAALAVADSPPGMRHIILVFVRRLMGKIKQPILSHAGVFPSIMQLVVMCNGRTGSPTESEEVSLLCTLCAVVSKHPDIISIFCNQGCLSSLQTSTFDDGIQDRMNEWHTCVQHNTQPIHSKNDTEIHAQLSSPHPHMANTQSCRKPTMDEGYNVVNPLSSSWVPEETSGEKQINHSSGNVLLDRLLSFIFSEDSSIRTKACEGIMVIVSLSSGQHASHVTEQSDLCKILSSQLKILFDAIPQDIDPVELYNMKCNWGFDTPAWDEGAPFPGCREITSFFAWLDYCNQLIQEAQEAIGDSITKSIRKDFLEQRISLSLAQAEDQQKPVMIALLRKCLGVVTAPALLREFVWWFFGDTRDLVMPPAKVPSAFNFFIDCSLHKADEVSLEALQFFQVFLEQPSERLFHNLVLKYLNRRSYYDATTSDSCAASWSDEEDERENAKDTAGASLGSPAVSRTLAPRNVHRIIERFLSLIPRNMHTADTDESAYGQYIQDVSQLYQSWISRCSQYKWPLEATFPESQESDDSCSSDSCPEADHENHFYEGPFMRMLFTRLYQLPYQSYQVNLRLTGVISQLAMLPHPYLHEYLLNPMLPVVKDAVTLFTVLHQVAIELVKKICEIQEYEAILCSTKLRLLQDKEYTEDENNTLVEGFIVLEEFCKELASIVFVKYQNFS